MMLTILHALDDARWITDPTKATGPFGARPTLRLFVVPGTLLEKKSIRQWLPVDVLAARMEPCLLLGGSHVRLPRRAVLRVSERLCVHADRSGIHALRQARESRGLIADAEVL